MSQGKADLNFIHGQSPIDVSRRKSSDFETALMVAVDEGCHSCTKNLIDHEVNINWQSEYDGYTAFLVACYHGNLDIGQYLLNESARIDAALTNGRNALHLVVTSRGGDGNNSEKTTSIGLLQIILEQLDEMNNVELKNQILNAQTNDSGGHFSTHWLTPLDTAVIWNESEMAKLLIQHGAKFNVMRKSNNLCRGKYSEKARLLEKLAKKEAAKHGMGLLANGERQQTQDEKEKAADRAAEDFLAELDLEDDKKKNKKSKKAKKKLKRKTTTLTTTKMQAARLWNKWQRNNVKLFNINKRIVKVKIKQQHNNNRTNNRKRNNRKRNNKTKRKKRN